MSFQIMREVVLFALAIYGAGLSTYNLIAAHRKDRRSVRASFDTVMATYRDGSLGPPFARLSATNVGHRSVVINSITLQLPNGSRMVATSWDNFSQKDTRLPATLKDGESASVYFSYTDIAKTLAQQGHKAAVVRTLCEDTVGGKYLGPKITVDVDEFRRVVTS